MSEDTKGKNEVEKSPGSSKSPVIEPNTLCPICLNPITNRSVLDACLHEFCYECISSWSQQHNHCPTCRTPYHYIMHNIISDNDFEMLPVYEPEPVQLLTGAEGNPMLRMLIFFQLAAMRQSLVTQRATLDNRISNLRNSLDETVTNKDTEREQSLRNQLERVENQLNELNNNLDRIRTTVSDLLGRERAFNHFERELLAIQDTRTNHYNSPPNHANNGYHSNASSNNSSLEVMIGNSPRRSSVDNGTSEPTISIDNNIEPVTSERTNQQSDVMTRNHLSKSNQIEKRPQENSEKDF